MKNIIALCSALFVMTTGFSQDLWKPTTYPNSIGQKPTTLSKQNLPTTNLFTLDIIQLKSKLSKAPPRSKTAIKSTVQLPFPNAKGALEVFTIYEASIMHPDLAAKYPNIKSYVGQGITDPGATIRFSTTSKGLYAMCRGAKSTFFINSLTPDSNIYSSYTSDELPENTSHLICGFKDQTTGYAQKLQQATDNEIISNNTLRTYRLAVSTTAEYTLYFGSKEAALAGIVNTMTYVNGIFETDFGITMELIDNTDIVIFEDPDTDPYEAIIDGTSDEKTLNEDLNETLTETIGSDNYDIGHLFGYKDFGSSFGNAGEKASVCYEGKGLAVSAMTEPESSTEGYNIVAHEMGHQFGASHTFGHEDTTNFDTNFEPGTGSTIMAYAGKKSDEGWAVVDGRDPYFHGVNIEQILNHVTTSDCGTTAIMDNTPPTTTETLAAYIIPVGTPFILDFPMTSGEDTLTYCWEQMDDDKATTIIPDSSSPTGPAFRSYPPTTESARYFPRLETVLEGETAWKWEAIPSVARIMNFRLTVRDNHPGGGAVSIWDTTVETIDGEGSFKVLEPISPSWVVNTEERVTWNVAGTTENGIDTPLVDIFLSSDGGNTFPITLAENTPNDGEELITVPSLLGTNNRVMVKAVDHIFYDISDYDFTISIDGIVSACASTSIGDMINTSDISNLIALINTQISSNGNQAAAEVAFTYQDEKLIIAGNPTYIEGVFLQYGVDYGYGVIRNDDDSLTLVSENDMEEDSECDFKFTIVFVCTTRDKYSYAENLPEVASELHLHPEMALLSYFASAQSYKPSIIIRSAGPTGKMSPRSYKYLSDNDFWTPEPAFAQNDYTEIGKHEGWSLPNYWLPQEEYEENGGWDDWLRECSATYYENQYTFYGVDDSGEDIDLDELGYFAIPRNPGNSD